MNYFQFLNENELVFFSSSLYTIRQRKEKFNKLLEKLQLLENYCMIQMDDWENYLILDKNLNKIRLINKEEPWKITLYIWKGIYTIDDKFVNKSLEFRDVLYI